MTDIFGLSTETIAQTLLIGFVIAISIVLVMGLRNRIILKLALRNIPRRPGQTVLIIVGIMLSTVIISASLGTGDTLSYSIKRSAVNGLGEIDLIVTKKMIVAPDTWEFSPSYMSYSEYDNLAEQLKEYENIDSLAALLSENVAVSNPRTSLTDGRVNLTAWQQSNHFGDSTGDLEAISGKTVDYDQLNSNEIIINEPLAEKLDAVKGDTIQLYQKDEINDLSVIEIVKPKGAGGVEPTIVMSLSYAQKIFEVEDKINWVLISNKGDAYEGTELSEEVAKHIRVILADKSVALDLQRLLSENQMISAISSHDNNLSETQKEEIDLLTALLQKEPISDELVDLLSKDSTRTEVLTALNNAGIDKEKVHNAEFLFESLSDYSIQDIKTQLLEFADFLAAFIVSFFMILGSFSMMVGVLLIFLIFVLLAAARRSEMGMTRAIGARRGHLIQMFVFEGTAYSLISSAAGVAAGLGVSALIVLTLNNIFSTFTDFFEFSPNFSINGIIISYCLGMVISFATVTVSAYRVSYLNIVTAVRGLPAPLNESSSSLKEIIVSLIKGFSKPIALLVSTFSNLFALRVIFSASQLLKFVFSLILLPQVILVTIIRLLVHFFMQGWLALIAGAGIAYWGSEIRERESLFGLGISITIVGIGLTARRLLRLANLDVAIIDRFIFTFMGIVILIYWIFPIPYEEITGELEGGPDILFTSGVSMVAAAVWTIMYNADIIVKIATLLSGRSGKIRPILVTAVAYPMSAKFRTGITLAMFALVVFTLTVMSVLSSTFGTQFSDPEVVTGGWDIEGTINAKTPIEDIRKDMNPQTLEKIDAIGGHTLMGAEVRPFDNEGPAWETTALWALDDGFMANAGFDIKIAADGYGPTSKDIWQKLIDNPNLAVVGGNEVQTSENRQDGWRKDYLKGLYYDSESFTPFDIEVNANNSDATIKLTIVGVLDRVHEQNGSSQAIYTSKGNIDSVMQYNLPVTNYRFKLKTDSNIQEVSRSIQRSFLRQGMETQDVKKALREENAAGQTFQRLFVAFMSLGLLVGVAALGVVSTRAVVERRQQIGVLRAVGYKRYMIQASFLLESSFISLMGVLIGLVLGLTLSYNAFLDIRQDANVDNLIYSVPWLQLGIIISITYIFAIITTFIPSRQAAKIAPAEALRYE